jgi:hypothetical protein
MPLANYKILTDFIKEKNINDMSGGFLEIGTFTGEGTAELAKVSKKIIDTVDPFELSSDPDNTMLYEKFLKLKNGTQLEQFKENTKHYDNIRLHIIDSIKYKHKTPLCFTFIDGNHDEKHVNADFKTAWSNTVIGGWVSFHDYKHDIPVVTQTIDKIIEKHKDSISKIIVNKKNVTIFLEKGIV